MHNDVAKGTTAASATNPTAESGQEGWKRSGSATAAAAVSETMNGGLEIAVDALKFGVEKSIRYHQRRRAHYEAIHRVFMLLIILLGSAAVAQISTEVSPWLGFASACLGAIDLVWALARRACDHQILIHRFTSLLNQVSEMATPAHELYSKWKAERTDIEIDEPPIFWWLEALCDNEMRHAIGRHSSGLVELKWRQRIFAHWWRAENFVGQASAGTTK